ncbi:MAG: hypothetical protein Q8P18_06520 [Pseudomonadota bacterium]|nr:hypothetical protein [Pseudomonadota bacterium]
MPDLTPAPPYTAVNLLDLTVGRRGAPPLWIGMDGEFRDEPGPAPEGIAATTALVRAARWISTRRTLTFERLFPTSVFHPDAPVRTERLDEAQARGLLRQVRVALDAAAVGGTAASADPDRAAQLRSACVTILAHVIATVRRDASFRPHADVAASWIFEGIEREVGDTSRPALRAHAIQLLQLRGPCLGAADKARATGLLRALVRPAPPYAELTGPWRLAMSSAFDFHEGECEVLTGRHGFTEVADAPLVEGMPRRRYTVLRAPFRTPSGQPIEVWARSASPTDENEEMGVEAFVGVLVNRHAQLGAFDMRASLTHVVQRGYKLMINGQCAGLTTRFAIARLFPDADIYSSWDSTYFRTAAGKVSASEAVDCFVAILQGMSAGEDHAALARRVRKAQWHHEQQSLPDFVQFVGPSHPLVVARYTDLNHDGKADLYDGFLDLDLHEIAEDVRASVIPRDPGVSASQIGGDAARGLNWAAGSLNRVTQYSDLWDALPGRAELFYTFQSAGFYSHHEPPADLAPRANLGDPGCQPSLCRYVLAPDTQAGLSAEVMFHGWLAHAGMELKRLLVAAEALWAAVDAGHLPNRGVLATVEGPRGMLLLTLAGLLEFPADQNYIDALWSQALGTLNLPDISRSAVRACLTDADHAAGHYYGSVRGLSQLLGAAGSTGALARSDALADARLRDPDPTIGRARGIEV